MQAFSVHEYGAIISNQLIASNLYAQLHSATANNSEVVELDFNNVKALASFCAKYIFGALYIELGQENYNNRIKVVNASDPIRRSINSGINQAIRIYEEKFPNETDKKEFNKNFKHEFLHAENSVSATQVG